MPLEQLDLSRTIAASPDDVFAAWMSSDGHAAMTGSPATITARVGNRHTAWGGYIHGWVLKVGPGRRAVFSWRTSDFAPSDYDSVVDLSVERAKGGGALIKLRHWEIPEGQGANYNTGWEKFYFEPIEKYFASKPPSPKKRSAKKPAAKKPVAKKPAAKKPAAKKPAAKKKARGRG